MEPQSSYSDEELARLRSALARAVAQVCPRWLADQADDLVQVALLRLLDIRHRAEGKVEFTSFYLRKAAYSALIDEIRRRRRRHEVALPEGEGAMEPQTTAASSNPERNRAAREVGRAIRDCLGRLIRPRRLAATLHLQGHSVPEVSHLMGWTAKKAENLVYRGLADLRECLAAKGVTP